MKMKTKTSYLIAILLVLATSLFYGQFAIAQSNQSSFTANLTYLTVELSYPSQVMPGDSVTVNLQATAKQNIASLALVAQILYSDGINIHQIASTTFDSNYMNSGGSFSRQIQFSVPQDAPRTSLFAAFTENVKTVYVNYYYYQAYNNSYSPYCYYDHHDGYYCQYYYTGYYNSSSPNCYFDSYYGYYCQYYYVAYPSYTYATTKDTSLAPLSYIKASTPEYVSLQSQYQSLQQQLAQSQSQNQQLQSQNQQLQNQNQQLQQNMQSVQSTNSQRETTISSLNQQLTSSQGVNGTLEAVTAGLAVIAIALGTLAAYYRGKSSPQQYAPANPQPRPSNSEPQPKS